MDARESEYLTQIAADTDPLTALAAVPDEKTVRLSVGRACRAGRGLDYGGVT